MKELFVWSGTARAVATRSNSKAEKLKASICFPLYPRKRTQVRHRAMSEKCHKRTHPPFETGASTKNSETVVSHLSGDWNFSEISIADQCPREMVVPKGRVEISLFQRPALYHAVSTVHLVPNIFWRSSHRAAPPAEIKRAAGNIACCRDYLAAGGAVVRSLLATIPSSESYLSNAFHRTRSTLLRISLTSNL